MHDNVLFRTLVKYFFDFFLLFFFYLFNVYKLREPDKN